MVEILVWHVVGFFVIFGMVWVLLDWMGRNGYL